MSGISDPRTPRLQPWECVRTYHFTCLNCGLDFEAKTSNTKKFCSEDCWMAGRESLYGQWPRPCMRNGFNLAFRNAIKDHVRSAKSRYRIEGKKHLCHWCGFPVDDGEWHHVVPISDLIERFLVASGLSRDDIEIIAPDDRRKPSFRIADIDIKHAWQNFHQKHGELVPVHTGACHRMSDLAAQRRTE